MPSAIRQININESKANAARVGPRLRLSRTPAKPIAACRIARSQSHPLRLSGRGRRRGETPECNPFSGLNHVTREVVIGKPDITSSGSRPEPVCSTRYSRCNRLWLRGQVWLTGIEIDRDRDVFVDHQPIAVDLLINVSHAHGQIQLLAMLIGASHALDAVPIGKAVVSGDIEVG